MPANEPMSLEDREIVTTRVFDAPRELVFKAWTDPRHLVHWWGPKGFTNTFHECDPRTGGRWRYVMHGPDGRNYDNEMVFVEVARPRRIVIDHLSAPRFRLTAAFDEMGDRTKLTFRQLFETAEVCSRVKTYAAPANEENMDRLASQVATMGPEWRELVLTRTLDAPRELVFRAWTEPAQLARWWGPKGFTNPVCELDPRPGGTLRIVMRAPDGAQHPMTGVFREIVIPERLVFTFVAVDNEEQPLLEGLTQVSFAERGGKTELTVKTRAIGLVDFAGRMLQGMEAGWTQSIERLAELVR